MADAPAVVPFEIKDCALVGIATGRRAQTLREMSDVLQDISLESIYYHFWGHLLRPRFDNPEYINDFASWSYNSLHDLKLAEQLAVIDAAEFENLETLRQEVIDVIEERLDESEVIHLFQASRAFHFIRSQIVVFDTQVTIEHPSHLADVIPTMSLGSIFYHSIDARNREPRRAGDFAAWLSGMNDDYGELCDALNAVDPYFSTLSELRQKLSQIFTDYFGGDA